MLKNKDFIVFSDDWGRHPFSCMHLMKQFLPDNRILWVNTIGMRYPRFTVYDVKRVLGKIRDWMHRDNFTAIPLPQNLTVTAPVMIPYNNIPFLRRWNRRSVVQTIAAAVHKMGFDSPIIIITVPNACDYVGYFDEQIAVYYCVDEFAEWPGVARELVVDMETDLLNKVDLVVAVSDELCKSKKALHGTTHLLTHGVDLGHFSQTAPNRSQQTISFLNALSGRPVIGYFGLFDERSDQNLLEYLLKSHPEWNLVILGKSVVELTRLKQYKNFYHHGPVSYDDLPRWASKFDVCIIPYVINKLTININPLKLKEYLATGKPVVSTPLPEAIKYEHLLQIGRGHEDFVNKIASVITTPPNHLLQLSGIADEGWKNKAEQFSTLIEETIQNKFYHVKHNK